MYVESQGGIQIYPIFLPPFLFASFGKLLFSEQKSSKAVNINLVSQDTTQLDK